jgi:RNA polymerase sigma factor (TIGR02999 family)
MPGADTLVCMSLAPQPDATHAALVQRAESGDAKARGALFAALYAELHRIARREAGRYGSLPSLGTTTLLHEAYLDIGGRAGLAFNDKTHFLAYAARAMRGLVIDHVRSRHAIKRGHGLDITSFSTAVAEQCAEPEGLQTLSDALDELAQVEPALAHLVDLKFFCGFSLVEIAAMTGVSERTAQRQWEKARLLLRHALSGG